jgi:pimeloyl-ACP methyl ester carboxylesterase
MQKARLSTGVTIAWEEEGSGSPLLLIPPMARDHHLWDLQRPELAREFRCISLDSRGTGDSDKPDDGYSIASLAQDAAALLDHLEIPSAHVAGSSMGAATAMELALARPDLVRSLSLITPWARTDVHVREGFQTLRALTEHAPPAEAERATMWLIFSPQFLNNAWDLAETIVAQTVSSPNYPPKAAALGHIDAGIAHDVLDRLGEIAAPALVIAGEEDRLVPYWHAEQVRDGIKGAEYVVLMGPGSSHGLAAERLNEVVESMLSFLRSHDS